MNRQSKADVIPSQSVSARHRDRRDFLITTTGASVAALAYPLMVHGSPTPESAAESLIGELYQSLSSEQKSAVALPLNADVRKKVNANWHVTKQTIGSRFFSKKQQEMVDKIVRNLTSESGFERLTKQTEDDDGGLGAYSIAWFGVPGDKEFEWMLTGRHLTLRADGNTQSRVVFGGPVVYGHGNEDSPKDNLFYYQTVEVQKVFDSLSSDQRQQALIHSNPPGEAQVQVQGQGGKFTGLAVKDLNDEQKSLVKSAAVQILSMYRDDDTSEAHELVSKNGGLDALHLSYYAKGDLLSDKIWDIWRIEGPSSVVHFRGAPHVHAYIHIKEKSA